MNKEHFTNSLIADLTFTSVDAMLHQDVINWHDTSRQHHYWSSNLSVYIIEDDLYIEKEQKFIIERNQRNSQREYSIRLL